MESANEAPASSSMAPPAKSRNRKRGYDEWDAHKPFIEKHYPLKGVRLKDIERMLHENGFFVNERQLKRKIAEWKLDKKVKGSEMQVIAKKRQKREEQGKSTQFRVRGQPVNDEKIDRWLKRDGVYGSSISKLPEASSPASSAPTPSAIDYRTPSQIGSPFPAPSPSVTRGDSAQLIIAQKITTRPEISSLAQSNSFPPMDARIDNHFIVSRSDGIGNFLEIDDSGFDGQSPAPFIPPSFENATRNQQAQQGWSDQEPESTTLGDDHDGLYNASPPRSGLQQTHSALLPRIEDGKARVFNLGPFDDLMSWDDLVDNVLEPVSQNIGNLARGDTPMNDADDVAGDDLYDMSPQRSTRQSSPAHSHAGALFVQSMPSMQPSNPTQNHLSPNQSTVTDPPPDSRRTRYLEKEEDELQLRLREALDQHGPHHPASLNIFHQLVKVYTSQGRYHTAEIKCKQLVQRCEIALDDDNRNTLDALNTLARILRFQGRARASLELSEKIHARALKVLSPADLVLLSIKNILARALIDLGYYTEAEVLLRDCLKSIGPGRAPDDQRILSLMSDLAVALQYSGKYDDSEKICREVVLARTLSLGPDNISVIWDICMLGEVLLHLNKFVEAEETWRHVCHGLTKQLGSEHYLTLHSRLCLAWALNGRNRYDESEAILRNILPKLVRTCGPRNASVLGAKRSLVFSLCRQKRFDEAEILSKDIITLCDKESCSETIEVIRALETVGVLIGEQGRFDEALIVLERALKIAKDRFGAKHCHGHVRRLH